VEKYITKYIKYIISLNVMEHIEQEVSNFYFYGYFLFHKAECSWNAYRTMEHDQHTHYASLRGVQAITKNNFIYSVQSLIVFKVEKNKSGGNMNILKTLYKWALINSALFLLFSILYTITGQTEYFLTTFIGGLFSLLLAFLSKYLDKNFVG
jgi:hypothetical protein